MKELIAKLNEIRFDETKEIEVLSLLRTIASSSAVVENPKYIYELTSVVKDTCGENEDFVVFDEIVHKIIEASTEYEGKNVDLFVDFVDQAIELLVYKLVEVGELDTAEEESLFDLYAKLDACYPNNKAPSYWVSIIEGYANCAISLGKIKSDNSLLNLGLLQFQRVLALYKAGGFPDYWRIENMEASTKLGLVSSIMDCYQIDKREFTDAFLRAELLLNEALDTFLESGTDFNIEYTEQLLTEYAENKG
jgi:hypothetical protein